MDKAASSLRSVGEPVSRCTEIGHVFGDCLKVRFRAHAIIVPVTDLLDVRFQVRQIGVCRIGITGGLGPSHRLTETGNPDMNLGVAVI